MLALWCSTILALVYRERERGFLAFVFCAHDTCTCLSSSTLCYLVFPRALCALSPLILSLFCSAHVSPFIRICAAHIVERVAFYATFFCRMLLKIVKKKVFAIDIFIVRWNCARVLNNKINVFCFFGTHVKIVFANSARVCVCECVWPKFYSKCNKIIKFTGWKVRERLNNAWCFM